MSPSEWLRDQQRKHGGVWYYPAQPDFRSRRADVMGPGGVVVSTDHSLGVARARCNALNAKVSASGNQQKREQ